jgi:hypothetical protein
MAFGLDSIGGSTLVGIEARRGVRVRRFRVRVDPG